MRVSVLPVTLLFSVALVLGGVQAAAAQFYAQHNLVSEGAVPADLVDPTWSTPGGWSPDRPLHGGLPTTGPVAPPCIQ